MGQQPPLIRRVSVPVAALAAVVACATPLVSAGGAQAQTAQLLYERAQEQERAALAATPQQPETLRKIARAYEAVAFRYPVSGYSDNALWQSAALFEKAFGLSNLDADREGALKAHTWLQREYPHSPFVKQAAARIAALGAASTVQVAPLLPPPTSTTSTTGDPRSSGSEPIVVKNITQSTIPRGERVTIELSGEASYSGERVLNPDRVFFDFSNASTASSVAEKIRAIKSPLIKGIRVGVPTKGVSRVVLELIGQPRFSTFPLYDPFRLVIDLEPVTPIATPPMTSALPVQDPAVSATPPVSASAPSPKPAMPPVAMPPPAPPASTQKGDYSLARQLGMRIARVVIDPGHGGHDPGAQANGVTEAELVLDVALRLEKLLAQVPGVEVVLTRRTNEYVPLEERTAIANREDADLFLSIHANAHRKATVRGVETYFLSFAQNEEAEAVAARENASSSQTMGTLPAVVKAIWMNNKLTESRELANLLQTSLVRKLRTQSAGVKDLGVKQAPFVVLIGAEMPSVLTEIAFLTNRPESSLLRTSAYRQQIALALRDGVVRYQDSLKKVTTVATRERDPRQ